MFLAEILKTPINQLLDEAEKRLTVEGTCSMFRSCFAENWNKLHDLLKNRKVQKFLRKTNKWLALPLSEDKFYDHQKADRPERVHVQVEQYNAGQVSSAKAEERAR